MARRRVAYRKRHQNKLSMFLISLVVLVISLIVSVRNVELKERLDAYELEKAQLTAEFEKEQARELEIADYRTYTQTKRYVEEVAKDKLGLVYEGEIVFIEEN